MVWPNHNKSHRAAKDRRRTDGDLKQHLLFKQYKGPDSLVNGYEIVNSDIGLRLHLDINKHLLLII